jgi:D-alanyl-lipoteichoic acid acyltransferase DltB (MBOAT superfamily)
LTFNSVQYFLLLAGVVVVYWRLQRPAQNLLLLGASYVFYGAWDWRFLSLIWVSTALDYAIGRRLAATEVERSRRFLLWLSVGANLSLLSVFKYFGFFSDSLERLLNGLGIGWVAPSVAIILPVGISFYTFQTISYTFDVYRRAIPAARRLVDFALYVAFFPQLVAGPIERASHFLPQITAPRRSLTADDIQGALALLALGLFKKVVVADTLATTANEAFANPGEQSSLNLLFGLYAFAFQIYADFSAYSDMARGSARLLGFDLLVNFRQPYLSPNIQVFWRTWHISLSNWLRDYLYVPLGGNRSSAIRTSVNLMAVMLLGGLWHGASWNFVVWGGIHGLLLVAHRRFGGRAVAPSEVPPWGDLPRVVLTFHAVCFAWIFFRAETIAGATDYLRGLVTGGFRGIDLVEHLWLAAVLIGIDVLQRRKHNEVFLLELSPWWRGVLTGAAAVGVLVFSGSPSVEFVYFQF